MRDPSTMARALLDPAPSPFRDPVGKFVPAPWAVDHRAWQRSVVTAMLGEHGCPERQVYHDLLKDGWDGDNIAETLAELGVIERRGFGEPFAVLVLPDARPERRLPDGPQFRRGRGGPAVDGLGNKCPAGGREVRPVRLGGRKV
jgi:hypothetical protein